MLVYGGFPLSARHVIDGVLNVLSSEAEFAGSEEQVTK